jgi:hypothetical protein
VGLASTLPSAEAPFNWLGETFTELPRTGNPRSMLSRDMAVMAPARLANCGILKPFLP